MRRRLSAVLAVGLLAVLPLGVRAQVAGDVGSFECRAVQVDAQTAVVIGGPYRNHGKLVSTASKVTGAALAASTISEACSSCIVRQFADRTPIESQELCGPDPVCGDRICSIGETIYACPQDCGADVVVGESTRFIPRQDACGNSAGRTCESLIGDAITDAFRSTYLVDFAITNSGGVRADLTCPTSDSPTDSCPPYTPPPYPITRGQVLSVLPFGNKVVTVSITGAELATMLENGVSMMPAANGRFPQVSGLCFTYDISAPVNLRVTGVVRQAGDGSCTGAAVDLTAGAIYVIAENDFMASGGDGYPNFTGRTTVREVMDQVVSDWISANTPIDPSIQPRIACTTGGSPACPVILP